MPKGYNNLNALQNGTRCRLSLGRMHPVLEPARKRVGRFRKWLEDAVEANGGSIGPQEACYIHAACVHQMLVELWVRRLRVDLEKLTNDLLIKASDVISREVDRRNTAVEKLKVPKPDDDELGQLFGPHPGVLAVAAEEGNGNGHDDASGSPPEPQEVQPHA